MPSIPTRLQFYTASLNSFISSSSKFSLLRSFKPAVPPQPTPPVGINLTNKPLTECNTCYPARYFYPSTKLVDIDIVSPSTPLTLYILDSSFDPPTFAHAHLCVSALRDHYASELKHTKPRLLLLLCSKNADKKISGATLEQRLVGMEQFAVDLLTSWTYPGSVYRYKSKKALPSSIQKSESSSDTDSSSNILRRVGCPLNPYARIEAPIPDPPAPEIDIALTSLPFFHDKSAAIEESGIYSLGTTHIHCTGYDTLVRVLYPKYYTPTHDLTPLIPFLERHKLRVAYRNSDNELRTKRDQDAYVEFRIKNLAKEGGKREWFDEKRIYMTPGLGGDEISSTKIRELVKSNSARARHTEGPNSKKFKGKAQLPDKKVKNLLKGHVGDCVKKWILGEKLYWTKKKSEMDTNSETRNNEKIKNGKKKAREISRVEEIDEEQ